MFAGFYTVRFQLNDAVGRSVMYVRDGKMLGGNSAFAHIGSYEERGEEIDIEIKTVRHNLDPNFRAMISGEEQPDEGQVAADRGISIGYFSQDVGEMSGRSAVAEVMDGAGPVSIVASELKLLETAMADPEQEAEMEDIIARYGEVQARFEELDGYALDGRAREVLDGLGFSQEMMDGDVAKLSGGWKMRVALARILLMRPDVMSAPSGFFSAKSSVFTKAASAPMAWV